MNFNKHKLATPDINMEQENSIKTNKIGETNADDNEISKDAANHLTISYQVQETLDKEFNISTLKIGKTSILISLDNSSKTLLSFTRQKPENFESISNSSPLEKNNSSDDSQSVEENSHNNENDVSKNINIGKWSNEEDEILKNLVFEIGSKNWKKISQYLGTRTPVQCLHRWTKILRPGLVKGPWTIEEDKQLLNWIKMNGPCKWSKCSNIIQGRSGKQCRERWFNTLNPNVKKGNWSPEEEYNIFLLYEKFGSKWSKIASFFEGRTENSIKNRFYSTLRRIHSDTHRDFVVENLSREENKSMLWDCIQNNSIEDNNINQSLKENNKISNLSNVFNIAKTNKISPHQIGQEELLKYFNIALKEKKECYEEYIKSKENIIKSLGEVGETRKERSGVDQNSKADKNQSFKEKKKGFYGNTSQQIEKTSSQNLLEILTKEGNSNENDININLQKNLYSNINTSNTKDCLSDSATQNCLPSFNHTKSNSAKNFFHLSNQIENCNDNFKKISSNSICNSSKSNEKFMISKNKFLSGCDKNFPSENTSYNNNSNINPIPNFYNKKFTEVVINGILENPKKMSSKKMCYEPLSNNSFLNEFCDKNHTTNSDQNNSFLYNYLVMHQKNNYFSSQNNISKERPNLYNHFYWSLYDDIQNIDRLLKETKSEIRNFELKKNEFLPLLNSKNSHKIQLPNSSPICYNTNFFEGKSNNFNNFVIAESNQIGNNLNNNNLPINKKNV